MAEPLVLSASSVTTYLRCGRQWFFAYVAGIKSPPSLKAVRGIAVHAAVETNMRQKVTSQVDLPLSDVLDAYDTSWTQETANGFRKDPDQEPGEIKDAGVSLLKVYQRDVAPKIQPDIVEKPIQFQIDGQPFSGQIDLGRYVPVNLYGDPDLRLEIRDTKTTGRAPDPSSYMLNMTGYAIAARQEEGREEADTVFDYLVATKQPYYREIRLGRPITDEHIRKFAQIVGDVSSSIQAGRFVPNGLISGACRWCGYRDICPAYMMQDPLT